MKSKALAVMLALAVVGTTMPGNVVLASEGTEVTGETLNTEQQEDVDDGEEVTEVDEPEDTAEDMEIQDEETQPEEDAGETEDPETETGDEEDAGETEDLEAETGDEEAQPEDTAKDPAAETVEEMPGEAEAANEADEPEDTADAGKVKEQNTAEPAKIKVNTELKKAEVKAASSGEDTLTGTFKNGVYKQTFDSSSTRVEIQNALNCIKDGTAKKVEITLKGKISINGGLVVYSNTTINAKGAVITETSSNGSLLASATARNYGDASYKKGYKKTENITIKGGKWDGSKKAGQVIRFVHSSNVMLDGLTVVNCTNRGHLISLEGVNTATVQNCTLKGHSGMRDVKEAIHLDIVHNETTTPDLESGEYDDLPDRNITITENKITDAPNAIGSHGAVNGVYHQDITISKNTISNIRSIPIKIYNYKNVTVKGNTISNSVNGIKVYTYAKSSGDKDDKDGEYFKPNKGTKTESLPKGNDYKITVSGNKLTNITGGPAIQTQGSDSRPMNKIKIEGNTINKTASKGIWLLTYCTNTSVKDNRISNTKSSGVDARSDCNGSVIELNTISAAGESGIAVMTGISKVSVNNNNIKNSKGHGIWIYKKATSVTVFGNTINGATQNGIYVSASSNKANIKNNNIKGTIKQNGIYVHKSTSVSVTENNIGTVGKNGIYVDTGSNSSKVVENIVGDCKGQGILIYKSNGVTLNKNTIAKSAGNGIQISASQKPSVVSGNIIKKSGKNGIHIYKSKNTKVTRNKVYNSKNRGISIDTGSNSSTVSGNKVKTTGAQGIYSYGASSVSIIGNTVTKAGKDGISAGQCGKSVKVTKNKITDIKGKGILIWSTTKANIAENSLQTIQAEAIAVLTTNSNVGTTGMTEVKAVSKKTKVVSGTARKGSKYTVTVDKKTYPVKIKKGVFKTGKISAIKSGTQVTVTEEITGKNKLITVIKAK